MSLQSTPSDGLRVGYSTGTKAAVALAAAMGWWAAYATESFLPGVFASAFTLLLIITYRTAFEITRTELRHTTWKGRTVHPRADFLAFETLDNSGKPGLLLRFQSGVVMLTD